MNKSSDPQARAPKPRSRLRRLGRWLMIALVTVLVFGGVSFWIATRSWFLIGRITPELERRLGGQVLIGSASYDGGGRISVNDITLLARSLKGPAAQVLTIRHASVTVDLKSLCIGRIVALNVELDSPVFRLAEDEHKSGRMNLMALDPQWSAIDSKVARPPEVRIRNAALEFGRYDGASFDLQGRRVVSGEMHPTAGATGWYNFELGEVDAAGSGPVPGGIFLKGQWNFASNEHHTRIDGIELDDRIYRMCPQQVRLWWDRMQLKGKVDGIIVNWRKEEPFAIDFSVENVAMTLPIETGDLWSRYKEGQSEPASTQPRLLVHHGLIHLGSDALVLDRLTGELTGAESDSETARVPYSLSLTISELPTMEWDSREAWMQRVLTMCPFEMKLRMDDFSLQRDAAGNLPSVELPKVIARILQKFQMTDWVLSTSVDLTRAAPTLDGGGQLVASTPITNGQAYIHKASGQYAKFPYRLQDIDAYLQFDNDRVLLHYLTGRGSGKSQIRVTGEVVPPDNDARIALQVIGKNVPVDDQLRGALKGAELEAFDAMFHRPSNDSLAAAGLLPDQAAIDRAKAELESALKQLPGLKAAAASGENAELAAMQSRIESLQRSIAAGPFELGGVIDLDLKVDRAYGVKQPTLTTGAISIQHIGMLYQRFPYPLRITGGSIDWQAGRIALLPGESGKGLPFITPGGGEGAIGGEILLPQREGVHNTEPALRFTVKGDQLNPAVYAAIPATRSELDRFEGRTWLPGRDLSRSAMLTQGIGIAGAADVEGTVHAGADGRMGFDFDVSLSGASAHPTLELARALEAHGELWPHGLTLADVEGSLHIGRDAIELRRFSGTQPPISVVATGLVDVTGDKWNSSFTINLAALPLESYVLNLAPQGQRDRVHELWAQFEPQGTFDAVFEQKAPANEPSTSHVSIQPREISLLMDGRRMSLLRESGTIDLHAGAVMFSGFSASLTTPEGRSDGIIMLDGDVQLGETGVLSLRGSWTDGRFDSPLIAQALLIFEQKKILETARQCRIQGLFNADCRIRGDAHNPLEYTVGIAPESLSMRLNDTPIDAEFDGGEIVLVPGGATIHELQAQVAGGAFGVSGELRLDGGPRLDLGIGFDGNITSADVQEMLPADVRSALRAIQFAESGISTLTDGRLHIERAPAAGHAPDGWSATFRGDVRTRSASLLAGVEIKDITGDFALDVATQPGDPPKLSIASNIEHARVMGIELFDINAPISLVDRGEAVRIDTARAVTGGGVLTAAVTAGIGERHDYEVIVEIAGIPMHMLTVPAGQPLDNADPASADPVNPANAPGSAVASSVASPGRSSTGGEMFARFAMSGWRGDMASRCGRGDVRILHSTMASIPLALQVLQMVQLTLPFSGNLDYVESQMYLSGDVVTFEHILLESTVGKNAALQLFGEGEMNLDTLELNTRFRSRSGVAIIRDVVGPISDNLYAIQVTGPLRNPKASIVPLPRIMP